ncbi:MAG TPA: prolipoprotein diacylglyceryl transferase [Chloroflexota bacterium]|nr:prolipoprotein diacylglyceryl transferase [Chloroflexota bacterium]
MIEIAFDPIIAQIGPFQLGWHGVFTALAIVVAVWFGVSRAERGGVSGDLLGDVVLWAIVSGLVGARLFHVLEHLPYYSANPLAAFAIWQGGIAVYGAFVGGVVGGWLAARQARLPSWRLLDAAAPAILVGQGIGRVGCLANGDAWGGPCSHGVCVIYRHANAAIPADLRDVPTHPYPLYEIVGAGVLLLGLWFVERRMQLRQGTLFLIAAVGYGVIRFSLSFYRQEQILLWGLQEAQLVAIVTGAAALGALLWRERSLIVRTVSPGTNPRPG